MNFFKSILADDPDSPEPESGGGSPLAEAAATPRGDGNSDGMADGWSFGSLIRNLSVQSESVIETYRKDLKEFGLGLQKESEIFRETASRAVKDLPASLEATASALDGVLKSTAEIIAKETSVFGPEPETPGTNRSFTSGRYSRFEAQLSAIQSDPNSFCEEPENGEEYGKWKLGFELEDYEDEIEYLIGENGTLESIYKRVVPNKVDHKTFWCRYFYRVDKLKQQERFRADLVKRAISVEDDDDELTWDVDDEDDGSNGSAAVSPKDIRKHNEESKHDDNGNSNVAEKPEVSCDGLKGDEKSVEASSVEQQVKPEEATNVKTQENVEKKNEKGISSTADDGLVKTGNRVEEEEEDIGWDEIADTGSDDDKKRLGTNGGSADKSELRKRLSVMEEEEDEDLSWDIEDDDDEPVKG